MVDYEKIGKRILEERKYFRKISQEKMAEDLGMYQADISNLEKAKSGSGITDLSKLDMIADYFDMPLESLLFGRRQDLMEKYYGSKMKLKFSTKKRTRKHETILKKLMGLTGDPEETEGALQQVVSFECGPYMIYAVREFQIMYTGVGMEADLHNNSYTKAHLYVVYQDEVIACMVAGLTTVMQHVYQPEFERLKSFIHKDIFDMDDTLQVLNPYWLLYNYPMDEEEEEKTAHQMFQRMDELRTAGEDRVIYYIENAYVREDCRRNGLLRMMLDVLKTIKANAIMWLSLEPTSGSELNSEYAYLPAYEASELGQLHLNASIAEHLGFTVDPKTVMRLAERVEEDGNVITENVQVRRSAYYLPQKIRNILNGDGKLLATARAREAAFSNADEDEPVGIDMYSGSWKKYGSIIAMKMSFSDEIVYAFARGMDWKSHWLGVSKSNPAVTGEQVETIERYDRLKDAAGSKYYEGLEMSEKFLGMLMFGIIPDKE